MASKKIVLTAEEKAISRLIESGKVLPVSAKEKAELLAAVHRKVESLKRGGARPGAGRKALGHIQTTLQLKKETRSYLIKAAGSPRGMGAIVDRLVEKAHLLNP